MSCLLNFFRWSSVVFCLMVVAESGSSAEPDQTAQTTPNESTSEQNLVIPKAPRFNINPQSLAERNFANESFWLTVKEQQILVLKYWARGKVTRGNAIILHAQGEHPDHPRVLASLSKQLSELGWHVFIPSLPDEDYPPIVDTTEKTNDVTTEAEQQTTQADSPPETTEEAPQKETEPELSHNFFAVESDYQEFINEILDQLMQAIQPQLPKLVLVANQNSGYWSLATTKKSNALSHVVLIEPQLPKDKKDDLEEQFNGQSLPVFTFIEDEQSMSHFITAFDRQLWRSPFLRINRGQFSNQGIELEDNRIAKSISGWIQMQQ